MLIIITLASSRFTTEHRAVPAVHFGVTTQLHAITTGGHAESPGRPLLLVKQPRSWPYYAQHTHLRRTPQRDGPQRTQRRSQPPPPCGKPDRRVPPRDRRLSSACRGSTPPTRCQRSGPPRPRVRFAGADELEKVTAAGDFRTDARSRMTLPIDSSAATTIRKIDAALAARREGVAIKVPKRVGARRRLRGSRGSV